ncbi:MAG TPA: PfkB family carbohydrate kinase [Actinomycetes bacterium]|nr:PfkB family carbohydrate kinase [Actinomycetes bacterium]
MTAPPPATDRPDVIVVGDVMTDVVARLDGPLAAGSDTPARITSHHGGSGANTAVWLAVAGQAVAFVGRVGADGPGRDAAAALRAAGVDVQVRPDPDRCTGTCVVLVGPDGERSMLPDAGANSGLHPDQLPTGLFRAGAHLHVSGYTLLNPYSREAGLAALRRARSSGMSSSVDASSSAPLAAVGADRFLAWCTGIDLMFANAAEATLLAGALPGEPVGQPADPGTIASALTARFAEVVVKLGAGGAVWCDAVSAPEYGVAEPVAGPVDTTGAGDAFAAGFLGSWLGGADPATALRAGARLAARAVRGTGARPNATGARPSTTDSLPTTTDARPRPTV